MENEAPYKVPRHTVRIEFEEGHEYHGAVARFMTSVSLEGFFDVAKMADSDDIDKQREALERIGDEMLLDWNLTDGDGKPVPPDAAGMMSLDVAFAMELLKQWGEAQRGLSAPLSDASTNGRLSGPQLVTTEASSQSH
jgi:hypothetical protein